MVAKNKTPFNYIPVLNVGLAQRK